MSDHERVRERVLRGWSFTWVCYVGVLVKMVSGLYIMQGSRDDLGVTQQLVNRVAGLSCFVSEVVALLCVLFAVFEVVYYGLWLVAFLA